MIFMSNLSQTWSAGCASSVFMLWLQIILGALVTIHDVSLAPEQATTCTSDYYYDYDYDYDYHYDYDYDYDYDYWHLSLNRNALGGRRPKGGERYRDPTAALPLNQGDVRPPGDAVEGQLLVHLLATIRSHGRGHAQVLLEFCRPWYICSEATHMQRFSG